MVNNRRSFLQKLGLGTTAFGLSTAFSLPSLAGSTKVKKEEEDQILFIGEKIAIANTAYGKVRGFKLRGIYTYLGIPYGADTSGENRFMPPKKPTPWTDVKPTIWWGNTAPQNMEKRYADPISSFIDHWNYDDVSEDCLRLNVWTPAIADGKKRPVIVWLHGGGYTNGNAIEQDGYHGENISRRGDVVYVSINHRLGPMGFANFAGANATKYAASGNVGMLDCVAALEWVKANITNFGGDPGSVTIIGQSGGGGKVCTLMAMPSAKGLFHKGVALSGATLKVTEKETSEKLGSYILQEAGLTKDQVDKLQTLPWKEYYEIATRASKKLADEMKAAGKRGGNWAPVADGNFLPQHPFDPVASPLSADVPLILCSTLNESSPSRSDASLENITLDAVKEKVKERFGDNAGKVIDSYAKAFPERKPIEIWSMAVSNRQNVVALANAKSKQKAPVYVAWFGWQPPLFDNRMRAFHCSDISFWFYNTDLMYTHTGGGSRPRKLSAKMADSFLKFARTGNPNGGGLPTWPKYTPENGETMFLDDTPVIKNDPDREARKALA
ncbi:carboxylesterase [Adhaeribacter arboris]|uniref:Carboxylic ester hydrolase n=1 Tax=Adhaeribacter arboris TaxID=2072846 RepID=A0A2T2YIF2_9BACT|nr:carboxylesterase family protein [Adhaeribacter arboris]PSR55267.1 carboxylesterase [Adhaeribacter arboris]